MSEPLADLPLKLNRWAPWRLALAATLTSLLWAEGSVRIHEGVASLEAVLPCLTAGCPAPGLVPPLWSIVLGVMLAAAGFFVARWLGIEAARKTFLRSSKADVLGDSQAPPKRALVLTLSPLRRAVAEERNPETMANTALAAARGAASKTARKTLLDQLCDSDGEYAGWQWQQPLRLLRHNINKKTLEVMVLVLSHDAGPQYRDWFRPLLKELRPELEVLPTNDGASVTTSLVDINDYNKVEKAINEACDLAMTTTGCKLSDLALDITGGTSVYSAAATVKTLNSDAVFTYVDNTGHVRMYNASITA